MEAQRYPMSVRFTGVLHKEKSKMYITSVLWSDQSDIVVYRTFREFKQFHKKMKKAFPAASKLKKSERIIPQFRDKKTKRIGPKKSLLRLKLLHKYCNELLSCDPRVTQSGDLIQFFQPKDQDLQPDFSKNSIIIMPSENELNGDTGHLHGGNVTQPFVTETYRCVASYETKDTKNKPFKVAVDEKVDVLIKDKAGWWLVENEDKRMAWFPAPYLETLDDDEDETDGTPERGTLCTAIKSYKATKDDELTVHIGTMVEVLQKSDNGWWLIRYNGKAGYIPAMYLQPYSHPHIRMPGDQQNRRSSSVLPASSSSSMLEQSHQQNRRSSSVLPASSSSLMLEQSHQLSLSSGNLLKLPPTRSSSSLSLQPDTIQRSRSLDIVSEPPPAQPAPSTSATNVATATTPAKHSPPPTIMVQMAGGEEERGRSLRAESDASFVSSSSSSSEFSCSDDLSSSSASLSLNLSQSATEERLRHSRTPPPGNGLSPTYGTEGKMLPSVSDPNLYKGNSMPKVPPRPQPREILTRCTTITRKNAGRGLSPTQTEILSQ
ncbi:NADPH oxidase organizer 1a [Hippoglossus stenolepis]|uniref:NADPH oxidase organizer 1a n=1 Tax=Hippoglossus stenolepis TaxID=195615 RepID=UPI00159C5FED|nr:NADPH oxidase organizer 1a [Hippoglossus stenolepis]